MIRTAFLICTVLLLTACNPPPNHSGTDRVDEPLVLEVYPVGSGMADPIESALRALLGNDETSVGNVRALPNGNIAVAAPASMQPGIGTLIEQLAESGPAETHQVRINQWLIEGTAAEQTSIPSNLASLEAELRDVASSTGDMVFERLDTSQHITLDGKHSNFAGKLLNSSLKTRIEDGIVLVDINTSAPMLGRVNSKFSVKSGRSLVIAQLGKRESEDQEADKLVIFIFQAEIL